MKRRPGNWASASTLDPKLGRTMLTDSKRLQQVLKNLLSNAFKFTAQGQVSLSVAGGQRRLECRPSGPGPGRQCGGV